MNKHIRHEDMEEEKHRESEKWMTLHGTAMGDVTTYRPPHREKLAVPCPFFT